MRTYFFQRGNHNALFWILNHYLFINLDFKDILSVNPSHSFYRKEIDMKLRPKLSTGSSQPQGKKGQTRSPSFRQLNGVKITIDNIISAKANTWWLHCDLLPSSCFPPHIPLTLYVNQRDHGILIPFPHFGNFLYFGNYCVKGVKVKKARN